MQLPLPSVEEWRGRVSELPARDHSLVTCVVGGCAGHRSYYLAGRHAAEFSMVVSDDWQGKEVGIALLRAALNFADNWLDLSKVELHVYTDNAAGIALYKEFGFETKGTRYRFAFRNGRYVDAYSITRNGLRQDVGACCFVGAIEQPYEGRIGRGLTVR